MSILDFKRTELCDEIWDENRFLLESVRVFIISSLESFFKDMNIAGYKDFTKDILVGSSLATFYYTETSDLDIKVVYDETKLKHANSSLIYAKNISDQLIESGRSSYYLTTEVPGTHHNLDVYFYSSDEYYPVNLNKYDSLYSISDSTWLQEPKDLTEDFSPDFVLNYAWDKAQAYVSTIVSDISKAKKSLVDLICLRDYLKTLDEDDIDRMKYFFIRKFNEVNDSIEDLIKDRVELKNLRTTGFEKDDLQSDMERTFGSFNYSDENLIFKVVQRYGYMTILSEIKKLYSKKGVTIDNVDTYLNLVM